MLRRRRGAERRHGVVDAGLVQPHGVHVAFDDSQALEVGARAARFVQAVQLAPLVKQHRLRGVQVLGLAGIDNAAAEGDDASAVVADGKHDAIAKAIVVPLALANLPALAFDDEARVGEALAVGVLGAETPQHARSRSSPRNRGEALDGLAAQAALRRGRRVRAHRRRVRSRSTRDAAHEFIQRLIGAPRAGVDAGFLRHLQSQARRRAPRPPPEKPGGRDP